MNTRFERGFALCFLLGIAAVTALWFLPGAHFAASVRVAAIGGSIALLGVIVMALPVLRVGPFQWMANLYFPRDDESVEHALPVSERRALDEQRVNDLVLQNVIGPYLIGVGTVVNGFSGFLQ